MNRTLLAVLVCLTAWAGSSSSCPAGGSTRPIAALIADLKKGDKERFAAMEELGARGEKAAEAIPALIALLPTKSEDVKLHATLALGKIGAPAVGPLSKAYDSKDAGVRFYAVWGLAFVGPPARSATTLVVKALSDPSAQVRRKAAYALGRIDADPDKVVGALITALGDPDEDVRQSAQSSLPKLGKAAVPNLIEAMKSDKPAVRNNAIKALGEIGADAQAAIPQLKALLTGSKDDAAMASLAATALAGIGAPALPTLTAAAADDSPEIRKIAVGALQQVGVPAVPVLVDLLGAKHVDVRRQCAHILQGIPVNDKVVIVGLGFATRDKDLGVKQAALQALQSRGPGAKLAERYVSALLTDSDPQIRLTAFHTLQNLGVDPRPGLKKALANPDFAVRIATAGLMIQLNLEVGLAEPMLREGLKSTDTALKTQAAFLLSQRGLGADVVVPIFLEGLKSDQASVRRQAIEGIGRYGTRASDTAPALIAALDDADDSVKLQAINVLRQIGAQPGTLFPAMIKILRRPSDPLHNQAAQIVFQVGPGAVDEIVALLRKEEAPAIRLTCLQTLAMVGPPAKAAVGDLIKALADPSARARLAAARALGNIGPDARTAEKALEKATKDGDGNVQQIARAALTQVRADGAIKDFQVQGVLTSVDPLDRVRVGSYHVVHTYPMKKGQTYTIDLISQWDNFLRLENAQGQQLAQDDDSGGFPNARIIFAAPADGWYRIIVTSFAPAANGPYTLKVR
jgi:HEAT repeat protein